MLATNVAETSLTVPGIRYVVDAGTARISRYSQRTKVQRLPIEAISQASANQRAGRCGRLADGICIRLYSEDDYDARPEFTEPEIQRTSLASVILQMTSLGLGDVAAFPFVDAPDARQVADGMRLLEELRRLRRRQDAPGPGPSPGSRRPRRPGRTLRDRWASWGTSAHGIRDGRWPGCRWTRGSDACSIEAGKLGCAREVAHHRRRPVDAGPARAARRQADPGRPVARAVP